MNIGQKMAVVILNSIYQTDWPPSTDQNLSNYNELDEVLTPFPSLSIILPYNFLKIGFSFCFLITVFKFVYFCLIVLTPFSLLI